MRKEPRQVIGRVGRVGEQDVVGWGAALGDERVEVMGFVVDGGEADRAQTLRCGPCGENICTDLSPSEAEGKGAA